MHNMCGVLNVCKPFMKIWASPCHKVIIILFGFIIHRYYFAWIHCPFFLMLLPGCRKWGQFCTLLTYFFCSFQGKPKSEKSFKLSCAAWLEMKLSPSLACSFMNIRFYCSMPRGQLTQIREQIFRWTLPMTLLSRLW